MTDRRILTDSILALGLAAVYFVAGKLGLALAFVHASATAVWPPTGIALAAFLLLGPRVWPGILLGAFLVNVTTAGSIATSVGIAVGNTLEGLVGATLVNRLAGGRATFSRARTTFGYAVLAGMLSPTLSATVGVTSLALGGAARWADYGSIWLTWWLGDAGGALVVGPVLLLWSLEPRVRWDRRQAAEAVLLLLGLVVTSLIVFAGWFPSVVKDYPLEFLCVPFLVWAAFRFGPREAATATLILTVVATWGTLRGYGPFVRASENESLLLLQAFVGIVAVMAIGLGAVVAERKRVEEAVVRLNQELEQRVSDRTRDLALSQARLLEAQEVGHIGSWEWDVPRNVIWWSEELHRIYGLDPAAFAASYEAFLEQVHPDDRAMVHGRVSSALRDGRPFAFDHRIVRPDGGMRTLHARGQVVMDPDGRPIRMMGTGQDISERKRVEEERVQLLHERAARVEAEEANRLKDEFLAMLGHELRNPLGAIASAVGVLDAAGRPEDRTARARQVIGRQVQHLARMVDDLLDVGRVATGKVVLDRRPVDLADVVRRSLGAMAAAGRAGRHRLEVQAESVWVHADETRLEQIVTNLVENAVKYTPAGGLVRVTADADGDEARLRVEDTGIGIASDLLPRIFNPFVQGDRSLDRSRGGLGIGLTLVRRLVELHDGTVDAASAGPDRGSTFTVRLPRLSRAIVTAPRAARGGDVGPRRVLLVEDHADAREMLRQLLAADGHEVHEAADGPEGIRMALALQPDVAIVDIGLPGLDGYRVAGEIRADDRGRPIFLVALTGYGQADDRRRALAAGFDAHLVKPVDMEALGALLARARASRTFPPTRSESA